MATALAFVPQVAADCPPGGAVWVGTCGSPTGEQVTYVCAANHCAPVNQSFCEDGPPCDTDDHYYCILGVVYFSYGPDGQSPRAGSC